MSRMWTEDQLRALIRDEIGLTEPPIVEPPTVWHRVEVPPSAWTPIKGVQIGAGGIHNWGDEGSGFSFEVTTPVAELRLVLHYRLASESNVLATRDVTIRGGGVEVAGPEVFPATGELWPAAPAMPIASQTLRLGGLVTVSLLHSGPSGRNYLDVDRVTVLSSSPDTRLVDPGVIPPPVEPPSPPVVFPPGQAPPVPTVFDYVVGRDGTLQQIIDTRPIAGKAILVPAGVHDSGSNPVLSLDSPGLMDCAIVGEQGSVLRGRSGIEILGYVAALQLHGLRIEPDPQWMYAEGVYIDCARGRVNQGGGAIVVSRCSVWAQRPGVVARNGINVWGVGLLWVYGCEVVRVARTLDNGQFGGAGSAFSIGETRQFPWLGGYGEHAAYRVLVEQCVSTDIGIGEDSADKNHLILDRYAGSPDGGLRSDYMRGATMVRDCDFHNAWGRGVQVLMGGVQDAPVYVERINVSGYWAEHLGQNAGRTDGQPRTAIGGYGAGLCGSLSVSDCVVSGANTTNLPAYRFDNFDGPGVGVIGSGNRGNRAEFNASNGAGHWPGNQVPAGFLVGGA